MDANKSVFVVLRCCQQLMTLNEFLASGIYLLNGTPILVKDPAADLGVGTDTTPKVHQQSKYSAKQVGWFRSYLRPLLIGITCFLSLCSTHSCALYWNVCHKFGTQGKSKT